MDKRRQSGKWIILFVVLIILFLGVYLTGVAMRLMVSGLTPALNWKLDSLICLLFRYSQTVPMVLFLCVILAWRVVSRKRKRLQCDESRLKEDWAPCGKVELEAERRAKRGKGFLILCLSLLTIIAVYETVRIMRLADGDMTVLEYKMHETHNILWLPNYILFAVGCEIDRRFF